MSQPESPLSQTASSGEAEASSNVSRTQQCAAVVDQFRRGDISKSNALLRIHSFLAAHLSVSFASYVDMLDAADPSLSPARDARQDDPDVTRKPTVMSQPEKSEPAPVPSDRLGPLRDRSIRARSASDSGDKKVRASKRHRTTIDESLFPWTRKAATAPVTSQRPVPSPELEQILELLDDWANDPDFVVRKIMLSPGCPGFPVDQWTNIVMGLPVELERVLGAYYSTSPGNHFTKAIETHGDWVIAFGKTIQATSFAIPQRFGEYTSWNRYMSQLFASVQPAYHHRVVDFDRAVRRRVADQKDLRLTDHAAFDDLRAIHLSLM